MVSGPVLYHPKQVIKRMMLALFLQVFHQKVAQQMSIYYSVIWSVNYIHTMTWKTDYYTSIYNTWIKVKM